MESFSTKCEQADGSISEIRVKVAPGVRTKLSVLVEDEEKWLQRCVWRFISLKHDEIKGSSCEFTMFCEEVSQLVADLKRIDAEESGKAIANDSSKTEF